MPAVAAVVALLLSGVACSRRSPDRATPSSGSDSSAPSVLTTVPLPPPTYSGAPYRGLGTWVDVFDFSPRFAPNGKPHVHPSDVDRMAALGIRTLYLQAARSDEGIPGGIPDPVLVGGFLTRAHARGMKVVAWYLPRRYDEDDLLRLEAIRDFRVKGQAFDGVALDIEWRADVPVLADRNQRVPAFSRRVRQAFGTAVIGAIVLPPVLLEVINTKYWAAFPWRGIAPYYNVWLPMTYWTFRGGSSPYHDAFRYTDENMRRLRANLGLADAPVHPIGGIGDAMTSDDVPGFVRAAKRQGSVGLSIYDFDTTPRHMWPVLERSGL